MGMKINVFEVVFSMERRSVAFQWSLQKYGGAYLEKDLEAVLPKLLEITNRNTLQLINTDITNDLGGGGGQSDHSLRFYTLV